MSGANHLTPDNRIHGGKVTVERIRLLIKHYSGELPDHHALYTESYRLADQDTIACLRELLAARQLLSNALREIEARHPEVAAFLDSCNSEENAL